MTSYVDLKTAGVPLIGFGQFITVAVNFLIVAFVVFLLVRAISRKKEEAPATPAVPPAPPEDVVLLREILAELKKKP